MHEAASFLVCSISSAALCAAAPLWGCELPPAVRIDYGAVDGAHQFILRYQATSACEGSYSFRVEKNGPSGRSVSSQGGKLPALVGEEAELATATVGGSSGTKLEIKAEISLREGPTIVYAIRDWVLDP